LKYVCSMHTLLEEREKLIDANRDLPFDAFNHFSTL